MTIQETAELLAVMAEFYPNDAIASTIENKVKAWHMMLADLPYENALEGLQIHVRGPRSMFPPKPGEIIAAYKAAHVVDLDAQAAHAWALVKKALRNANYDRVFGEAKTNVEIEWEKLPATAREVIGSPAVLVEWAQLSDEQLQYKYNSFIQAYKNHAAQKSQTPSVITQLIAGSSEPLLKSLPE